MMQVSPSLEPEIKRVRSLQWAQFSFAFAAYFLSYWNVGNTFLWHSFVGCIFLFFYSLYFRTVSNLYYSYWTFSGLFFILYIIGIIKNLSYDASTFAFWGYIVAWAALVAESYLLSKPTFFPMVNWWEFDFRYRRDLKAEVIEGENVYPARITDVRMNSIALHTFTDLRLDDPYRVKVYLGDESVILDLALLTHREQTLGRGIIYGAFLNLSSSRNRIVSLKLKQYWQSKKRETRVLKYGAESGN